MRNVQIRWVPPNEDASRKPVIARNKYSCQFCVTVLWAKAIMAQKICRVGSRNGALPCQLILGAVANE